MKSHLLPPLMLLAGGAAALAAFLFSFLFSREPIVEKSVKFSSTLSVASPPKDREQFLIRVDVEYAKDIARQVQYVRELISVSRKIPRESLTSLAHAIVRKSRDENVDPILIASIIRVESRFKPHVRSNKGARGLMQLLPSTAKEVARKSSKRVSDIHDIDSNIELGINYLRHLEDKFNGNLELALVAYNWGPGNLDKALEASSPIPDQPLRYAEEILSAHRLWKREFEKLKTQLGHIQVG